MKPLPRTAILVVNARSRKGRAYFRKACRALKAAGIELLETHAVRNPKDMGGIIKRAVDSAAPMVIVGGGDGSLSASVDYFVGKDTVFALLPLGTANSFARTLGIPLEIEGAVAVIASGIRRRIDLGMIDDDYFANCAAMGISPLIAETVPHGLKRVLGRVGYMGWSLIQMMRFRSFALTVEADGASETVEALEVRVANGAYHGGTELIDAQVDSGEIVVQVVTGRFLPRLGWNWAMSLAGSPLRDAVTREFRGRAIRLSADPPQPISIDGEVLAHTPVMARVAVGIIEVAAPAPTPTVSPARSP